MQDTESVDMLTDGAVSASVLMDELLETVTMAGGWADRCRLAEDASWCIWAGQTDDGLKHAWPGDEEPPFPWENSSDTRIRLVEEKVREHCRVAMMAAKRGNWNFQGTEGEDFLEARRQVQLLKWQISKQIPMARRERNLFIYWGALYGCSIMGLGWKDEESLGLRKITTEDIIQTFQDRMAEDPESADEYVETLQYLLQNPEESREWIEAWLQEFFPDATQKRVTKAAKQLTTTGETHMPVKRRTSNNPTHQAMRPMEHVFFPIDTESMATSQWAATRRWMNRGEVEAEREKWGDSFCDELLQHDGESITLGLEDYNGSEVYGKRRWGTSRRSVFSQAYEKKNLYEVFYFYHRSVDADGLPGIYRSVLSAHVMDEAAGGYLLAEQEIYDDGTGVFPFEEYTIWDDRRSLLECEGIPHLLYTQQLEKKSLRDGRQNRADITLLPPLKRHMRDRNQPLILGPDMPIFESVPDSTSWMKPPAGDVGESINLERSIDREVNRLTGSPDDEVPAPVWQVNQEFIADQFADAYGRVLSHTHQLNQMYLDEVTVTRVSGSIGKPFKVTREEIQGEFDVSITFDPRELDMDYAMKKFESVARIASELDRNGITDTNQLVKMGYMIIDPAWADMLVQDENVADEKEIRAVKDAINDILGGQKPALDQNMNSNLRLNYFKEQKQTNPVMAQVMMNEADPRALLFAEYEKHLSFMYEQQYVNPAQGRTGGVQKTLAQ